MTTISFKTISLSNSSTTSAARLGELAFSAIPKIIETPAAMLYVRSGVVPDVTYDFIPDNVTPLLEIPLGSLVESITNLENTESYATFARLSSPIYCPYHDSLVQLRPGGNGNLFSSVWTKSGRKEINIDRFNKLIQLVKPTMYETMFDGDTPFDKTTDKRFTKDRERSRRFLESSLTQQTISSNSIIVPLVGGHDKRQRQLYLNDILRLIPTHEKNIFGISFEGIHSYGSSTEHLNVDSIKPLIEETRNKLNEYQNLLFTMPLLWRPDNVIRGIDLGLDLFSGAYIPHISDHFIILIFRYNNQLPSSSTGTEYNINSKEYANGKQSLLSNCQCYACQNYTQAYVYHLIQTKELLGRTLINIHNLHHYHAFFQHIRQSLKNNTWNEYRTMILEQYPMPQPK